MFDDIRGRFREYFRDEYAYPTIHLSLCTMHGYTRSIFENTELLSKLCDDYPVLLEDFGTLHITTFETLSQLYALSPQGIHEFGHPSTELVN